MAHANIDNLAGNGLDPTNHWTLFLAVDGAFIHVGITPIDIDRPGIIFLENKLDFPTEEHIHVVSVQPLRTLTVEDVLAVIIENKRDNYIFTPVGEGCRYWLYTLANDLVSAGILSQSKADGVQADLGKYWPYPTGSYPVDRPFAKGRFF